ncbi:hypothetical protein GOP47_0002202 [Adiantum capillus-veneris]|nr:hypothetical protein GOP47_0002202 [Adiantum capillus-veneris]
MDVLHEVSGSDRRHRLVLPMGLGCVPPWPEEGDIVIAKGLAATTIEALVHSVDVTNKKALLYWKGDHHEETFWVDWKFIFSILIRGTNEVSKSMDERYDASHMD